MNLVTSTSRLDSGLTENPAFSRLPPIKIQNPDAAPKQRPGKGKIDPDALEAMQRDPNFNKMVRKFNATVMMCMPNKGGQPPTRRGIQS